MAREQQQQQQFQDDTNQSIEGLRRQRRQVEQLARSLTQQANEQWRKAIEGLVALPAAITVGAAASTLYFVGFVTRGLEVFQQQTMDASRQMQRFDEEQRLRGELRSGEERSREERGNAGRGEAGREMPTA